jgi:uncharacterized protein (DUF1330 family)
LLLRIAALLKPFGNRFAAAGGKEPPTEGQWTASFLGRSFFPDSTGATAHPKDVLQSEKFFFPPTVISAALHCAIF